MAEKNELTDTNRDKNTRDRTIRRHFISECKDSRIIVETHLSPAMQRIYRRHFDGLSRSVYLIRYYSRIAGGNSVEAPLTKEIIALMDEINENLNKKIMVADKVIQNNNIKVTKTLFEKTNVTIIDPLANRFLQSINIAQELDEKLSALWLACFLDDDQRRTATQEIENQLRGIQGKSRAISIGLRDRVRAQRTAVEPSSGINITEAEAAELELGEITERKSRKSFKDDTAGAGPDADNTDDINYPEAIEVEIPEEIAA
jgi:hypothetical protein